VRARADLRAVAGGRATVLAVLRGEAPIGLFPGAVPAPGWAQVWMVGSAGGPLGGDDVELRIEVEDGAKLAVGSVAASIALSGASPSFTRVHVVVGSEASLVWAPEPLIVTGRADHRVDVHLTAAPDSRLWWRDELVLGRAGERPGRCTLSYHADLGGRPWVRQQLAIGAPAWDAAAVVGAAKVVGSVLATEDRLDPGNPAAVAAVPPGPAGVVLGRVAPGRTEGRVAPDRIEGRVAELRPAAGGTITLALAGDRVTLDELLPRCPFPPALPRSPLPSGHSPLPSGQRSHHVAC
jgi:urease accessory protein